MDKPKEKRESELTEAKYVPSFTLKYDIDILYKYRLEINFLTNHLDRW